MEASDGILNLLLFFPLGWVIGRRFGTIGAAGWGLAVSAVIEGLQFFIPGRFVSAADLLANAFGAGFGAWVRTRKDLPVQTAAAAVSVALLAPAVLLLPAPPEDAVYYGQWMPSLGRMEQYGGRMLETRVGRNPVYVGPSEHTWKISRDLKSGAPVRLLFLAGPPPQDEAPIFSIFDRRQNQMFMLGAEGDDVFVRLWRLGTALRFRTPTWWWKDVLAGYAVGDTIHILYAFGDHAPCLSVEGLIRCLSASTPLGSWSLLAPDGQGNPVVTAAGWLWAFLLGAPFGMLSLKSPGKVLLVVGLGLGVVGLSSVLPYWVTPWWGILIMFSGTLVACLMEPWIRVRLER
jgi:hypothetical protein